MKKLYSLLALAMIISSAFAGDTITVRSHDKVHMNWYGNFDQWAVFPSDTNQYERIWLTYTMGCPSAGCSQWDYTTQIFIRKRTGQMDSTLEQAPTFTVNGNIMDTVNFSNDTTYVYSYNTTTNSVDSAPAATMNIVLYQNSSTPTTPTDTLVVWTANYYNHLYDSLGNIYDSVFVSANTTLIVSYNSYYNVFEVINEFEIARVITPYGGGFTSTWNFPYKFDVTDYASLLKDSMEIRAFFSGWSDGFTVTLDFAFVKGTPAREAYKVVNLWNGSFPYGDPNNDIENYLTPKSVQMDALASFAKLKIFQTGHGFGGNEDCAEFCAKSNFIYINGVQKFSNLIWKDDCGLNPLYPQNGTWLYDRANWCPGSHGKTFEHELFPIVNAGQSPTIDMDMEGFTNSGNNNCSYTVGAHVVFYKSPNFTLDAAIEDILAPSNYKPYNRFNPICAKPRVSIKNNGTSALTSLNINYGVKGGVVQTFQWTGNLSFLATEEVTLGNVDWANSDTAQNVFEVTVSNPNANTDQYADNNTMQSIYAIPPMYPNDFVIVFKTNLASSENAYYIKDGNDSIVFSKTSFANSITYKDTVHLADGCYTFELDDSGKDGISFWANSAGSGYIRFYKATSTQQLKSFIPDFGTSIIHSFTIGYILDVQENIAAVPDVFVYPNPAEDLINVEFISSQGDEKEITVFNATGQKIYQKRIDENSSRATVDMRSFDSGLYFVIVSADGKSVSKKLVLMR